jgi:CheY-like chemotaxis protein
VRRYLLVDDNREFAGNLAEILRDAGDEAEVAQGGREALARVRDARFDAVVTDMRMPEMGGAQLLHEIRRLDPGLAAVVVTAHAGDIDLEAAWQEGLLAVLPKPVPVERLLELLGRARRDGLVLVVVDDPALRENLSDLLRSRGFAAVTAASVVDTDRLGSLRPFCALVDRRVPGGPDGEAMRRVSERFPGLSILVLTGPGAAAPLPHRGLFAKPFDTAALLAAVERLHREVAPS